MTITIFSEPRHGVFSIRRDNEPELDIFGFSYLLAQPISKEALTMVNPESTLADAVLNALPSEDYTNGSLLIEAVNDALRELGSLPVYRGLIDIGQQTETA